MAATDGYTAVGTYAALTNSTSANAKTEIKALVDVLGALITNKTAATGGSSMSSPSFDTLPPAFTGQLLTEIAAFKLAVTNGA